MLNLLRKSLSERNALRLTWHRSKACIAAAWYGFPARKLTIIGITGTDGKTTTVGMVAHILHTAGKRVGSLSTACFTIESSIEWNQTQKTSPSPFIIQRFLRRLVHEGCIYAVLEYSSHGLVQGRTLFTWPKVAAITNTSREHLDYHGSMEQYRQDKGKLFWMLRGPAFTPSQWLGASVDKRGTKVLNNDDVTYEPYLAIPSKHTLSYSLSDPIASQISLRIPGTFNIENALCAITCAEAVGIPHRQSIDALRTFAGIPGRMERIDEGQPFTVFIDFTVTPEAYRKTLTTVRAMLPEGKRLLVLTGSCGDRMREKRPEIGKIVSQYADVTVVTTEDPYTEDPEKIIAEVWAETNHQKTEAHRIVDRRQAIAFLLHGAQPGDVVLLCGKGSDTTMQTRKGQIPWNEREIVRELLRNTK